MSIINKISFKIILLLFFSLPVLSEELTKVGTYKDWETIIVNNSGEKTCFAQSKPVLQSPKKGEREARLFVTFRPSDKIEDEVSTTSGYEFNSQNSITASSGKSKYKFDIAQEDFAWISSNKIEKRMIGRLQSNKIKKAVKIFDSIDSVSRLEHLNKINANAEKENKIQSILLQINISNDQNKDGFPPKIFLEKIESIFCHNYINIKGMMTIGSLGLSEEESIKDFKKMKSFYDQVNKQLSPNKKMKTLSMGMSQDYHLAIQEGSNMVRVGGGIFG